MSGPDPRFPTYIPSNTCYLNTTRALRRLGVRRGFNSAGTLLEGQYLLTAAHNLYDSFWTTLVKVEVTCRSAEGDIVRGVVSREGIERTREVSHYDRAFKTDYAFLKLDDPLPVADEVTPSRTADLAQIAHVEVVGYPGGVLRYGKGAVLHGQSESPRFSYDIDTAKGMSGGPVWATDGDQPTLVGIHVTEGGGRLIDGPMLDAFDAWKSALRG